VAPYSGPPSTTVGSLLEANFTQPLLRGAWRALAYEEQYRLERDFLFAVYDYERFRQTFAAEIVSQYYALLSRRDQLRNEQENIERLESTWQWTQVQAENGEVSSIQAYQARQDLLEAQVRSLNFSPAGADQALEHRQVFRIHDQAGAALTVSYPLMAEGAISGAMRLLLPADALARRELAEIEELLQETAEHVGLVVKKDEDVRQAKRDGLTGLLLKKELSRDLREEFGRTMASGGRMALLMMDIDHFKAVNDTHGHLTGDTVLKAVAACVSAQVRSCDRAYRYGGEEYARKTAFALTDSRLAERSLAGDPVGMTTDVNYRGESGVPFLMNVPFVGALFRSGATVRSRSMTSFGAPPLGSGTWWPLEDAP